MGDESPTPLVMEFIKASEVVITVHQALNGRTPTSQSDVKVLAFHRSAVPPFYGTHICHEGLVHVRGVETCS